MKSVHGLGRVGNGKELWHVWCFHNTRIAVCSLGQPVTIHKSTKQQEAHGLRSSAGTPTNWEEMSGIKGGMFWVQIVWQKRGELSGSQCSIRRVCAFDDLCHLGKHRQLLTSYTISSANCVKSFLVCVLKQERLKSRMSNGRLFRVACDAIIHCATFCLLTRMWPGSFKAKAMPKTWPPRPTTWPSTPSPRTLKAKPRT